jgi:uncharacterized membrane protein (UPF0127 family)
VHHHCTTEAYGFQAYAKKIGMAPKAVAIANETKNTVLGERIRVAETSLSRMVGLLRHKFLEPGSGLLIYPSQAIHTVGMKFGIDVIFVDRNWRVVALKANMVPFRMSKIHWRARCVVELPVGTIDQTATAVGDQLGVTW